MELRKIEQYTDYNVVIMLVGAKCDLMDKREVTADEARKLAGELISFEVLTL